MIGDNCLLTTASALTGAFIRRAAIYVMSYHGPSLTRETGMSSYGYGSGRVCANSAILPWYVLDAPLPILMVVAG